MRTTFQAQLHILLMSLGAQSYILFNTIAGVVGLNRLLWRRPYHLAETRYTL